MQNDRSRPWTVYAMVIASAVGLIWGVIAGETRGLGDVLAGLLTVGIAYSLWIGQRWAFTLSFMLVTLCAGLGLTVIAIQIFLMEQGVQTAVLWTLGVALIWIALLLHPATKEFAGLRDLERVEENRPN